MKRPEELPLPLLLWYREHARKLPWRETKDPYRIWLSEVMLQQTRVAAVMGYYERFLRALPTVEDLAAVPDDELMKLWQGLGYYSRARNLKKAAGVIVTEYGGKFPADLAKLKKLPGVGDYTAGAVASIAFGLPEPAVDGNVLRVLTRINGDESDITLPATRREAAEALRSVMPLTAPGEFNQAMMELGATVCLPNGAPLCDRCPAKGFCAALREGTIDKLPVKPEKKPRKVERRVVYLLFRDGKVALRRRPEKGLLAGLWEYPNTLEGEEAPVKGPVWADAGTGKHIFTHIEWHMRAMTAVTDGEELPEGWVWAGREELRSVYAVPNAFSDFRHKVEERLGE